MITKNRIRSLLKKRIIFLDGATGTQLQQSGMGQGVCPEKWCIEHPHILAKVHSDYVIAGADIIYTSTFGANQFKLQQYNISNAGNINKKLALIARGAVGRRALVAGDIGPTGEFIEPFGKVDFEEAVNVFKEQVKGLLEGGVDLFAIETMMDIQEARAALIAIKETCDLFTIVTMTYEKDGRTLNGTDPLTALVTLQSLGADAVGCNCSTGPQDMSAFITAMKPYAKVPLVAKPNAGMPRLVNNKTVFDMEPADFAVKGGELLKAGVNMLGGCCGTTPRHIFELKKRINNRKPVQPVCKSISALSSARGTVILHGKRPLCIAGESINPTGNKALRQALSEGNLSVALMIANEQAESGASILDVNVGVGGIDEIKTMKDVICLLSIRNALPLVIDSSNIDVIAKALRIYPGRALINSISGETHKLKELLPVAAKYGAMFILLPLDKKGIPKTLQKRKEIIQTVFQKAKAYGFTKEDVVVDCLAMAVSSDSSAALETLKTIQWCTNIFKTNTIMGLSNVSFGMPRRQLMNASFLGMSAAQGLTMAIANPRNKELMDMKMATDVLADRDRDAAAYISYSSEQPAPMKDKGSIDDISSAQKVYRAVVDGSRDDIIRLIDIAISENLKAENIVDEIMIPAITYVGELFDRKEYFLPQLIASAETMKTAFNHLKTHLKKGSTKQKEIILLATVRGDVHDIGKKIVALMLENHGFRVIDIGKDVSAEVIVKAIKTHKPKVVGLSALMTTTMVNMQEVIELARKQHVSCTFLVGGAVLTESYAKSIGAEYAKDGVDAVKAVKRLSSKK